MSKMSALMREVKPLLLALGLVFIVRTVAAEPYTVPTPSMVPTLMVGDKLVASKFAYGYSKFSSPIGTLPDFKGRVLDRAPERGDVIVFRLPRDTSENYVKRVIGLPGDHVQLQEGRLYINGTMVPRRAAGTFTTELGGRKWALRRYIETLPGGHDHPVIEFSDAATYDNTSVYQVPADHYFMMGDNRDNSLDSRLAATAGGVGFVPAENLVGRADVVLYSVDPDVAWWNVAQWPHALHRFFTLIS